MPNTVKYALTYPLGTVAPNVPAVMQTLAQSVENALIALGIEGRAKGLLGNKETNTTTSGLGGSEAMADLVAVSLVLDRWYEAVYRFTSDTTVANMALSVNVKKSATTDSGVTGTAPGRSYTVYTAPVANQGYTNVCVFRWKATATETVNIKAILLRATGSVGYNITDRQLTVADLGFV